MDKLLTVKDLQKRLTVSRSMAWKLVPSGEIPHVKIGKCVRLQESDVGAFVDRCASVIRQAKTPLLLTGGSN